MCHKRYMAITFSFCRDLHLTLMFSAFYEKICLKEDVVLRKFFSHKIIVTLVTQGLSFLSRPVARVSSPLFCPQNLFFS